jgi:acyl-coenzyme A thioesterase PaaI-like protein
LTATAEEVRRGRTLATYRVLVRRADGKVIGHFTGTVYITP